MGKVVQFFCLVPAMVWMVIFTPSGGSASFVHLGTGIVVEPYMSISTGLRCSQCHVNRTGGGARNDFGSRFAQTRLPLTNFTYMNRNVTSFLSWGANFRMRGSGTVSDSNAPTDIDILEESLQLEARVIPDVLALYVDQIVGPSGLRTREAFALLENLPLNGYVKAGKFMLPYGLRLADDQAFIRERTRFNHQTPDEGVEVGIEPGKLSLFTSLTNGPQLAEGSDSGKQITTTAALIYRRFRVGASASRNDAPLGKRDVAGAFGGFNIGRFTFLGELDYIFDKPDDGLEVRQLAGYVEGDFLATRGFNLKATYGYLDPRRRIGENERVRARFGLEMFPIQFLQFSIFYTLLQDIPQATTDLDRLSFDFHVFF